MEQDKIIDVLIDTMAKLNQIENEARITREALEEMSIELHALNDRS